MFENSLMVIHLTTCNQTLHLKNVLHVPEITKNLFFIGQLTFDNNIFIKFHPNYCLVKDKTSNKILLQ